MKYSNAAWITQWHVIGAIPNQCVYLKTGTLIWSGEGRSIVNLEAFFNFYGSERTKQLQGICCDMWPALNTDMVTDILHPPEFTDEIFKKAWNMPFV